MHDDARRAEDRYREHGYPASRVFPEFDPALDVDRRNARVRLRLRATEKGKVVLHFIGNHAIDDKELLGKTTIFTAGSYDETELQESARELHRLSQSHGFLEAQVTLRHRREGELHDITFLSRRARS